jgi:Phosphotransferase enzyme family
MVASVSGWTDPQWLAEAHAWIRSHVTVIGEIEQPHVRPWSTVMRVPTADGPVWFKANTEALRYEAGLVSRLAARRPDAVPALLALDLERGWMLMTDAGTTLRAVIAEERSLERWLDVLPLYAGVQIDMAAEAEELLALGVPDLRLATLAHRFERFLDDLGGKLGEDEARLRARLPWIREACEELSSYGVPETVQHDDFHDAQVFVRDGRYLLMDWGDACISHPFFTLSVTLEGVIAWGLDDVESSVDVTPFRDAYLEPFAGYGGAAELTRAVELALRLGWACRAVNGHLPDGLGPTRARLRMLLDGRA